MSETIETPAAPEPEIEAPAVPEGLYDVAGIGRVLAHEGGSYIVRLLDGRVCGFPAKAEPSEANAIDDLVANPAPIVPPPVMAREYKAFCEYCDAKVPGFSARILVAARSSAAVAHWVNVAVSRNSVHLDSPDLAAAFADFVTAGLMTEAERSALLAP